MGNQYTCAHCQETLPKPPDGKTYFPHYGSDGYFHQECLEEYDKKRQKQKEENEQREAQNKREAQKQREENEKTFVPDPSRYDSSSKKKN